MLDLRLLQQLKSIEQNYYELTAKLQALTHQQLDRVWSYDYDPGSNIVDVYVGCLRKKLGIPSDRTTVCRFDLLLLDLGLPINKA